MTALQDALSQGMQVPGCSVSWSDMTGTDSVRRCKHCNTIAYRFGARDEREIIQLIQLSEPGVNLRTLRLHRRSDGTYSLTSRPCSPRKTILNWLRNMLC